MTSKLPVRLLLVLVVAVCNGCGDDERVSAPPRAEPAQTDATSQPAATQPAAATATASGMPWTVPAGWTQEAQPRPMRVATFRAGEGDAAIEVAVSQFPGDVGGLLANVNRWRGQVGLAPITEAELSSNVEPFENPGFKGVTMRLKGQTQHMVAAAITEEQAQRTWFVKAVGTPQQADAHEAAVTAFARSFGAAAK